MQRPFAVEASDGSYQTRPGDAIASSGPGRQNRPVAPRAIVLFDGVCNLCNGAVQFILDRDPGERFHFASLQSDRARALLGEHGRTPPPGDPETIYLIEDGRLFDRSTAALRIARHLSFPWWLAAGALGFALVTSLLAAIVPTLRASRIDPVRALRHE